MNTIRTILNGVYGTVLALGLISASPAYAVVTDGDASAYALQANLFGSPILGPIPNSSVTGNDSDSDSVISLDTAFLDTGVLNSSASSNVDGSAGPKTAESSSSIAYFDLDVIRSGLSADLISSYSNVSGDQGSFVAMGNSSILNLTGYGLFSGLNGVTITGAPNQTLLSLAGIEVIANRQMSSCTAFDCSQTTDALYVNVLGIANLTLASSSAHLAAPIPEPATAAMLMAGLLGMGGKRLRKMRAA